MGKLVMPKWPVAEEAEKLALMKVLNSNTWWRNQGEQVKEFEREFSKYHDVKYGVGVTNGTVAIEVALKALGIKAGDEVIVPDFTFFSTVSAVLTINAIPVLVDVTSDTFCIDPKVVKRAITEKTKAIIPVHLSGHICDMDTLCALAKEYHLYMIEDCSHAHGARRSKKMAGSFGDLATFSFQNAKLMTAGEGGIIIGNDLNLVKKVFLEVNCGREENDTVYNHVLVGTNARMCEFQGAVLNAQLGRYKQQMQLRMKNYEYLSLKMQEIPGIKLQRIEPDIDIHSHYMIMFYYDKEKFGNKERNQFIDFLRSKGIPANRSYEALHRLPILKKQSHWKQVSLQGEICQNTERISNEVVCIAHNILLGDYDLMDFIVETIWQFKMSS